MTPKVGSPEPTGPNLEGTETEPVCSCPECEVVLPEGLRFSFALGMLQANGWHLHADDDGTVEWTAAAARRGRVDAQRSLGQKYLAGKGVPQDYVRAYGWLNIAAAAGDGEAARSRDAVRRLMTREQVAEAQRFSTHWYEQHRSRRAKRSY